MTPLVIALAAIGALSIGVVGIVAIATAVTAMHDRRLTERPKCAAFGCPCCATKLIEVDIGRTLDLCRDHARIANDMAREAA